jgi:hypothetical protein
VPFSVIHRHPPGGHVILTTLVAVLAIRENGFCAQPTFDSLTEGPATETGPGWSVITHESRRALTRDEYTDIIGRYDEFDLFLDGAATTFSQSYPVGHRDAQSRFHRGVISIHQMHALTELIARAIPLRASDIRCLQGTTVQDPASSVEAARRAIDVRLSRYRWRSFHTISGENRDQKAYLFRPPASLRYACIVFGGDDPPSNVRRVSSRSASPNARGAQRTLAP